MTVQSRLRGEVVKFAVINERGRWWTGNFYWVFFKLIEVSSLSQSVKVTLMTV